MTGILDGRVVLVTGGARGIGAGTVRRCLEEGASVVAADVRDEVGEKLVAGIGDDRVAYQHLDVTSEEGWAAAVDATVDRFGKLDGLVNNAGIFEWIPLRDYPLENYRRMVDINQVGVFLGMRSVVPALERAGGGAIVNVSSGAGLTGVANAVAYTASKFAVTGMTKVAALELKDLGVRVNSVHPGFTRTPLVMGDEFEEGTMPDGGQQGAAEPVDIANVIVFLLSDQARHASGAHVTVDLAVTSGATPR